MSYTVLWLPATEAEIAQLWIDAESRAAVAAAADAIDRMLAEKPLAIGESRDYCQRVLFVRPLAVKYQVSDNSRMVFVTNVWSFNVR